MSENIKNLEPKSLWNNFAALNAVPRPSKKEERIIAFIKQFGETLGLPTFVDSIGNVIIKKPATAGKENAPTLVIQSHLDMVHQKNSSTNFNFDDQGIEMRVEGDWVKANGTTLGADNGIGVAAIMAILEATNIPHPVIEALFTIDEETGMTGALGLKGGLLNGKILLNLDTEDDDELTIGCAGGVDVTAFGSFETINAEGISYSLQIKGLTGGHSGMDIYKGRGNANKIINRILATFDNTFGIKLCSVDGGSLRNAIPRESLATFIVTEANEAKLKTVFESIKIDLLKEYQTTDPNLNIILEKITHSLPVTDSNFQNKLFAVIAACTNGIYRMSPDINGLVQSSNNLARVLVKDGKYSIQCLTRSSLDSEKWDLANSIKQCFGLMGAKVSFEGSYPGWTPAPDAKIVKLMREIYEARFKEKPKVNACHAGLECGILGTNYPGMEMISFGPNIRGAHSPDETVQISSVLKFWGFFLEVLNKV